MILSEQTIIKTKIIAPMKKKSVINGVTGGLSSCGYDIAIAEDVFIFPSRFVLASSVEKFYMPNNVAGRVHDKSTWIRRGLSLHNTFIEPGWIGYLTLELKNVGFRFFRIKRNTPIAQVVFEFTDQYVEHPYIGKYQNQKKGPQPAILENVNRA